MRAEFIAALKTHEAAFAVGLTDQELERLADYYELIQEHNPILHLVGPVTPAEFAVRHILESLTLLEFLPKNTRFADVGTGAGLPSIPCLIVRGDLQALLIESKEKKTKFLEQAVGRLGIADRGNIINRQFAEVDHKDFTHVTCRALDKFTDALPKLLKWSQKRRLLLFGGERLGEALTQAKVKFDRRLTPMSEKRYLFISNE